MTPYSSSQIMYWNPGSSYMYYASYSTTSGIRPVINLSSDVTITNGTGTITDPYVIG